MTTTPRVLEIRQRVLTKNDELARGLRERLRAHGVFTLNLVSLAFTAGALLFVVLALAGIVGLLIQAVGALAELVSGTAHRLFLAGTVDQCRACPLYSAE